MPLPIDPTVLPEPMDPSELIDYVCEMGDLLTGAEVIDQFTITMSAEGTALGVSILEASPRAPSLTDSDKSVRVWPSVSSGDRTRVNWDSEGTGVAFNVHVRTNSSPYRERERTFLLTIRQR